MSNTDDVDAIVSVLISDWLIGGDVREAEVIAADTVDCVIVKSSEALLFWLE